jgi:hypothetical protein
MFEGAIRLILTRQRTGPFLTAQLFVASAIEVLPVKKNIVGAFLFLALAFPLTLPAEADWGKLTVQTGAGDEFVLKHGLLGRKMEAKDRLGDGFAKSHGILGTKSEEVSVLGNGLRYHKGILGFSSTSAHTMLGDSLTTHKNPLFHTTNVNVSGINQLVSHYLGARLSPSVLNQPTMPTQPLGRFEPPAGNGNQQVGPEPGLH